MAGVGANFVLDKGLPVLATYNSSSTNGVQKFRCVKFAAAGTFDICTADTDRFIGVVQEDIDATKVATNKAIADVRMLGISTVLVTTAASIVLGSPVTMSTGGGVKLAASGDIPIGLAVGITGTIADGNLIQVLLTPGLALLA
jgi:predicted TIM-barrel fold metal-dependent hydrolase